MAGDGQRGAHFDGRHAQEDAAELLLRDPLATDGHSAQFVARSAVFADLRHLHRVPDRSRRQLQSFHRRTGILYGYHEGVFHFFLNIFIIYYDFIMFFFTVLIYLIILFD